MNNDLILNLLIVNGSFEIKYHESSIRKDGDTWKVRYESYFNPHANPKSLMDVKYFTDLNDAVTFFIECCNSSNSE